MRTGTCERCGGGFVDTSPAQGRRFCSDTCRKRHHEHAARVPCPGCGRLLGVGSGNPSKRPDLCRACRNQQLRDGSIGHEVERLWAEGKTLREISDHFGWDYEHGGKCIVTRYRQLGFNLPHRYSEARVEAQRRGRWPEKAAA